MGTSLVNLHFLCAWVPLVFLVSSIHSRSINDDGTSNYFESQLDLLQQSTGMIPVAGQVISPIVTQMVNFLKSLDAMSGGALSQVVNSLLPCNFVNGSISCGHVNLNSLRKLAKTLFSMIPIDLLPPPISSIIRLVEPMILN